jgi:hypothetical protein
VKKQGRRSIDGQALLVRITAEQDYEANAHEIEVR